MFGEIEGEKGHISIPLIWCSYKPEKVRVVLSWRNRTTGVWSNMETCKAGSRLYHRDVGTKHLIVRSSFDSSKFITTKCSSIVNVNSTSVYIALRATNNHISLTWCNTRHISVSNYNRWLHSELQIRQSPLLRIGLYQVKLENVIVWDKVWGHIDLNRLIWSHP